MHIFPTHLYHTAAQWSRQCLENTALISRSSDYFRTNSHVSANAFIKFAPEELIRAFKIQVKIENYSFPRFDVYTFGVS